jgi:hypothetical protein
MAENLALAPYVGATRSDPKGVSFVEIKRAKLGLAESLGVNSRGRVLNDAMTL